MQNSIEHRAVGRYAGGQDPPLRVFLVKKTLGIFVVFVLICVLTATLSEAFLRPLNVENLIMRIGLYGIMAFAAVIFSPVFNTITRGAQVDVSVERS